MAALFGNSSDGHREPRSLVEFRAGKMRLSGSTVTADKRKGLVYMKQEDRLMHFYWKDRKNNEVIDDLIIFPGEVEFKRVTQCTTGRVFLLKFRDRPDRKYFYWMQEPKDSRDEELQKKVNDLINNPPDPSQSVAEGIGGGLQSLIGGHGSLQNLLTGAHNNPQILEQLLSSGALSSLQPGLFEGISQSSSGTRTSTLSSSGGGGGSSEGGGTRGGNSTTSGSQHTPARPQQQTRSHQLQLGDLQNILSSMNIPSASQAAGATQEQDKVNLTDVVTSDVLRPLSSDPAVQERVESHLPPTSERLETVLTSPQFQQALGTFNSALQSGQLGPLMSQFGLGGQVVTAANTGDVGGFVQALQSECGDQGTATSSQGDGEAQASSQGDGGGVTSAPPPGDDSETSEGKKDEDSKDKKPDDDKQ